MPTGRGTSNSATVCPEDPEPTSGRPPTAPGFADSALMAPAPVAAGCPTVPEGQWVIAAVAAADTASAVTAVARADLLCRADGLRCRVTAAGSPAATAGSPAVATGSPATATVPGSLRCRAPAAGADGRPWVTGGCAGLRCRAWGLATLESSGRYGQPRCRTRGAPTAGTPKNLYDITHITDILRAFGANETAGTAGIPGRARVPRSVLLKEVFTPTRWWQ